jgi:anaerobic ribonucleoside-triphosphate reductase activating protein
MSHAGIRVRIASLSPWCTVLGPGPRAVIWVQGCARRCTGCIKPDLWDPDGGCDWPADDLAHWAADLPGIAGLTVSGGEPMEQAPALAHLIERVRARRDLSVWLYTGWTHEEILSRGTNEQRHLLSLLDVLVDGPYVEERARELPWRGSDNQRLVLLTERDTMEAAAAAGGKGLQITVGHAGAEWVGVPPPAFREEFAARLRDLGIGFESEGEEE